MGADKESAKEKLKNAGRDGAKAGKVEIKTVLGRVAKVRSCQFLLLIARSELIVDRDPVRSGETWCSIG
jgi:hypothetical protein